MRILPLLSVLLLASCGNNASSPPLIQPGTIDASETFAVLFPTITGKVNDLQGEAETFQGYSAYLRFRADNAVIDKIIADGSYQRCVDTRITEPVNLYSPPPFNPPWNPQAIAQPECYEATLANAWSHSATHYLLIDRTTGIVYFCGSGA